MSIQEFIMRPIGVIHTPFTDKTHMPIQASRSQAIGRAEIYLEFADGLKDIENFSHIFLLYAFHRSSGYSLHIKPFLDDQEHGIFASRYPSRPNPIGISIVRILSRHKNTLTIEGVDMLDGTPLLDIKPYVPDFDVRTEVHAGWYETRSIK
jgi:tRNA-Thr(GGU) m(6)t(6)A37 methyltransferase TsaA